MKIVVVLAANLEVNVEIDVTDAEQLTERVRELAEGHAVQEVQENLEIRPDEIQWTPRDVYTKEE